MIFVVKRLTRLVTVALVVSAWEVPARALDQAQTDALVKEVDERQRNSGDYKSVCYIEQKEKDKPTKIFEAIVFRRDTDDKWMILFTKPRSEAGKGYLRIDKNLFLYEPSIGKWDRQTERASIAGTSSRRNDFDESRLADEYQATFRADSKLGKFAVHEIKLVGKPGVDVSSPMVELWVDQASHNILKRVDSAISGKKLRTVYYPTWEKRFSKSKKSDVFVPKEIRIFDELEKDTSTVVALKEVSLDPLEANIFTKAWLEAQSK